MEIVILGTFTPQTLIQQQTILKLKGLALKDNTHMYREASRNLGTAKSYPQGHLLYYETYTSDWYKAFVYNNGKRQYVYINKNDVENIVKIKNN